MEERGGNPRAVVSNPRAVAKDSLRDDAMKLVKAGVKLGFPMSSTDPNWPSTILKAVYVTQKKADSQKEAFNKYLAENVSWDYSCGRAKDLVYKSFETVNAAEKTNFENWLKSEPQGSSLYAYHFEYKVGG